MPIITSIKPQKSKKRVNIYLDNKFGFGIDLDNFVLLKLKVNQELSDGEVEEIVKVAEFQKVLDKLLMFATLRPRSIKEINDYFKRKKVHQSLHEELFNRLNKLKLTDDLEFSKWWVEQRNAYRPKSKVVLNQELRIKGIDREIISKVLSGIEIDEDRIAKQLIDKKLYRWKNIDKRLARQKIAQYLQSKGFGWVIIKKVISDLQLSK